MGRHRHPIVALVLLLGAACGTAGPDERAVTAAGAGLEELPAPTTTVASTTTTPTTAAPAPTTTARPAPTPAPTTTKAPASAAATGTRTTRVPVTPSPPIAGYSPAPPIPGVAADGYGGYGGFTEVSAGPVTLELSVYPREQYFGEHVQVWAKVTHPENVGISSLKIDYGNGQVLTSPVDNSWYCNTAKPASAGNSAYVYPAPGSFSITATVTFETCMGIPGAYMGPPMPAPTGPVALPWFPEPHQRLSAAIPLLARPDTPPRPVGPPPGP